MNSEKAYTELLVQDMQLGDQSAWERLIPIIQPKIKVFAQRLLSDSDAADDCAQDVLCTISRRLYQLQSPKAFHAWMYRIVRNRCHDYQRQQQKQQPMPDNDLSDEGREVEQLSDQQDLIRTIGQLPTEQQAVIFLFYYEGFQIIEIANILEKPAGTIKSWLFMARNQIKHLMQVE